jgi:hypothetical protein
MVQRGAGRSPIPPPDKDDTEDVAWALSTAEAMDARGDRHDALKWLRRAAEAAAEASNEDRSFELAHAAASLAALLQAPPAAPPRGPNAVRQMPTDGPKGMPTAASPHPARVPTVRMPALAAHAAAPPSSSPPSRPRTGPPFPLTHAPTAPPSSPPARAGTAPPPAPPARVHAPAVTPPPAHIPPAPPTPAPASPAGRSSSSPARAPLPLARPAPTFSDDTLTDLTDEKTRIGIPTYATTAQYSSQELLKPHPPDPPVPISQAVRVVVWRGPEGVRVAPQGTRVSAISFDAVLVALDPNADLASWLAGD